MLLKKEQQEYIRVLDTTVKFSNLLTYIEANLDSNLDTESLSKMANLSKFHFHRQCKASWGVSVYSVIKLLKMKRAAYLLAYRDRYNILDIALISGYESNEAFSRAFVRIFKVNPRAFRLSPDWNSWQEKYEPIIQLRNQIMNTIKTFEVDIIDFPETTLAVLEHRGAPIKLANTIRNFIEWRKDNKLPPSQERTFNLLYDDPNEVEPNDYRFDVCCTFDGKVKSNDYGIVNKTIPMGRCAVIRHVGSDDTIGQKIDYLYSSWIKESKTMLRDFPIFFERVSFFPEVPENEMITDVFLPII